METGKKKTTSKNIYASFYNKTIDRISKIEANKRAKEELQIVEDLKKILKGKNLIIEGNLL